MVVFRYNHCVTPCPRNSVSLLHEPTTEAQIYLVYSSSIHTIPQLNPIYLPRPLTATPCAALPAGC